MVRIRLTLFRISVHTAHPLRPAISSLTLGRATSPSTLGVEGEAWVVPERRFFYENDVFCFGARGISRPAWAAVENTTAFFDICY